MQAEINTLTSTRVPRNLTELMTLGRTLKRRAEHSSKQEDSGPNYTPNYEEPMWLFIIEGVGVVCGVGRVVAG